jgi:hypothetical protein
VKSPTCGEELAQSAEVPESLARLFTHVATNMDAHATWVGTDTVEARREHDAMRASAAAYRALADAAARAAELMRTFANLAPAPHDPARLDRRALLAWMAAKVEMQRELARLLLDHAAQSAAMLDPSAAGPVAE